ncbi:MAG: hypothetical protein RR766_06590, partial [Longicatena sp.]
DGSLFNEVNDLVAKREIGLAIASVIIKCVLPFIISNEMKNTLGFKGFQMMGRFSPSLFY